ncbi:hypothetical protein JCM3766R1_004420 [Sporobolomyces carnicolor]
MATRPVFDSAHASALLRSAFQAELEAVHRPGPARAELYKQPSSTTTTTQGGAWGSAGAAWANKPTNGLMADGKDFAQALAASLEKAKQ